MSDDDHDDDADDPGGCGDQRSSTATSELIGIGVRITSDDSALGSLHYWRFYWRETLVMRIEWTTFSYFFFFSYETRLIVNVL